MKMAERKARHKAQKELVLQVLANKPMTAQEIADAINIHSGRVYVILASLRKCRSLKRRPVKLENGMTVGRYELK